MKTLILTFFLMLGGARSPVIWAAAPQPPLEKAPEFSSKAVWLNSRPLKKKVFQKKVTLIYFWDYTSANCLRDLTYVKRWNEAYRPYGFQTVWIHAPEFEFAKIRGNVEAALKRYHIPSPVLLDNQFSMWELYKVYAWPGKVIVDGQGIITHRQMGEEQYLNTERVIREQIEALKPSVKLPAYVFQEEPVDFLKEECGMMTTETYIGYKRAHWWGGELANRQWSKPDGTTIFKDRGDRVQRGFFLHGLWSNHEDYFQHARETKKLTDYVGLIYYGSEVYSVLGPGESQKKARIYVTRDEAPIPKKKRGVDIQQDPKGRTYVELDHPRLYHLIHNEDEDQHEIKLWSKQQGVAIHSFSFANRCLSRLDIFS